MLSDIDFIVAANIAMAKEIENLDLDRETLSLGVKAVFDNPHHGRYVICEVDGKVCGSFLVTTEWSDWRNNQVAWIQSLYILEQHRGKGLFRKMFSWIEEQVNAGHYAGVRLYVDTTNEHARKVYSGVGMTDEHYMMFEKMA